MSVEFKSNTFNMSGLDAAKFTVGSEKGLGKLKAIHAFFKGISVSHTSVKKFVEAHQVTSLTNKLLEARSVVRVPTSVETFGAESSKASNNYDEVALYNGDLKQSRIDPDLDGNMDKAYADMDVYDFIKEKFESGENVSDLGALRGLSSDEVLKVLEEKNIFTTKELKLIRDSETDLEGSPYW